MLKKNKIKENINIMKGFISLSLDRNSVTFVVD